MRSIINPSIKGKVLCVDDEYTTQKLYKKIELLQDDLLKSNHKLHKALRYIKRIKVELENKNADLLAEKTMLQNSLKQISLMIEDRERTNRELEELSSIQQNNFNSLIGILSSTIESKRQYHRGHSKKVAEISCFIATALNLPDKTVRDIEIASLLHELGKLAIPDDLAMKKPDEYSQTEKVFLSRHPVEAASMLDTFFGFKDIALIIKHFHENVDGTGTPDGLERKDIPIGSRILAAANIFDNLVYRKKGSSIENSFQVIENEIGKRLDAKIVYYLYKYANAYPVKDLEKAVLVKLYELESGMKLAAGIYTQNGAKLLPKNTILKKDSIMQIAQYARSETIEENVFIKQQ